MGIISKVTFTKISKYDGGGAQKPIKKKSKASFFIKFFKTPLEKFFPETSFAFDNFCHYYDVHDGRFPSTLGKTYALIKNGSGVTQSNKHYVIPKVFFPTSVSTTISHELTGFTEEKIGESKSYTKIRNGTSGPTVPTKVNIVIDPTIADFIDVEWSAASLRTNTKEISATALISNYDQSVSNSGFIASGTLVELPGMDDSPYRDQGFSHSSPWFRKNKDWRSVIKITRKGPPILSATDGLKGVIKFETDIGHLVGEIEVEFGSWLDLNLVYLQGVPDGITAGKYNFQLTSLPSYLDVSLTKLLAHYGIRLNHSLPFRKTLTAPYEFSVNLGSQPPNGYHPLSEFMVPIFNAAPKFVHLGGSTIRVFPDQSSTSENFLHQTFLKADTKILIGFAQGDIQINGAHGVSVPNIATFLEENQLRANHTWDRNALTVIHELFHSMGLAHPFYYIVDGDSKRVFVSGSALPANHSKIDADPFFFGYSGAYYRTQASTTNNIMDWTGVKEMNMMGGRVLSNARGGLWTWQWLGLREMLKTGATL